MWAIRNGRSSACYTLEVALFATKQMASSCQLEAEQQPPYSSSSSSSPRTMSRRQPAPQAPGEKDPDLGVSLICSSAVSHMSTVASLHAPGRLEVLKPLPYLLHGLLMRSALPTGRSSVCYHQSGHQADAGCELAGTLLAGQRSSYRIAPSLPSLMLCAACRAVGRICIDWQTSGLS